MLKESISIGSICKRQVKHFRIGNSLLQTVGYAVIVVFRFNYGNGRLGIQIEYIICFQRLGSGNHVSPKSNLSICESYIGFHCDMLLPMLLQRWGYEIKFYVFLSHLFLGKNHVSPSPSPSPLPGSPQTSQTQSSKAPRSARRSAFPKSRRLLRRR